MNFLLQQLAIVGINIGNKVPISFRNQLLSPLLNIIYRSIEPETLEQIKDKSIALDIIDLNNIFHFKVRNGYIELLHSNHSPSVTFRGSTHAFLSLLMQKEDPDTLFFSRKLTILGNTEVGLEVKSIFDNIDLNDAPLLLKKLLDIAYKASQYSQQEAKVLAKN